MPESVSTRFAELCDQRRQRTPLQHLTGIAHFRHLQLQVGPGVFVPRPETELLAGAVLTELSELDSRTESDEGRRPFVIDLCSGSGAISLSVATESERVDVLGVEREPAALDWSLKNLEHSRLGESTVEFILGDASTITEARPELRERADIVVTNPPYVPDSAVPRDPEVADHDPAAALYGGDSGLEIPGRIILEAEQLLRPGGLFLMEHSEEQGAGARELLASTASLRHAATFQDYTGRDRYTVARRES
ncbi:protein-(glutamine-N5) methyltransferase, release factor-specific [Brevibacterium linens]|uniref:Protein-(Glutamine-N5) methyltransferase, release factor-specific n=2 Tax=Brevibacterium TaxID=1696 RepID=A0A0B9AR65_BRELN|nr:protein-(glutamine-N5) methyltransferase, release factor-specific [Brevibacterium linens]